MIELFTTAFITLAVIIDPPGCAPIFASLTAGTDAAHRRKMAVRSAFVAYVMAGDPDPATSLDLVKALPKAGADVIELGIPFTDPMADGPSIQAAGLRALNAGMTLKKRLSSCAASARTTTSHRWC